MVLLLPVAFWSPAKLPKKGIAAARCVPVAGERPEERIVVACLVCLSRGVSEKRLRLPFLLSPPESCPKNELASPVVLLMPVLLPKKELKLPVVLFAPASRPKNEFWKPCSTGPANQSLRRDPLDCGGTSAVGIGSPRVLRRVFDSSLYKMSSALAP
jgi:hypothetical protein